LTETAELALPAWRIAQSVSFFGLVASLSLLGLRRMSVRIESLAERYVQRLNAVERTAEQRESEEAFHRTIRRALSSQRVRRDVPIVVGLIFVLALMVAVAFNDPTLAVGVGVAVAVLPAGLAAAMEWFENRRIRRIERALPDAIDILASCMSAGLTFQASFSVVASSLRGPLALEARVTANHLAFRPDPGADLVALGRRANSPFVSMFVSVIRVHLGAGGDVVAVLRDLGRSIRRVILAQEEVRSKTERFRYEAYICTWVPFVVIPLAWMLQPRIYSWLLFSMQGRVVLVIAGVIWGYFSLQLRRIARTPV
jgi:tight adherence protein B